MLVPADVDVEEWQRIQRTRSPASMPPSVLLTVAIMERAYMDLALRQSSLADDALRWVENEEPHVFSFRNCCEILGLDYGRTRATFLRPHGRNYKFLRTAAGRVSTRQRIQPYWVGPRRTKWNTDRRNY